MTDGDQFDKHGSRVLLQDDELWPMARGMMKFLVTFIISMSDSCLMADILRFAYRMSTWT